MNTRPVGVYLLELMVGRRGQFFSQELLIGGRLLIKLLAHSSQVLSLPATGIFSPTFVCLLFFSNLHQGWPHGGSRLAWFEFILGNTFSLGIEKPPSSRDCSMRHLLQSLVFRLFIQISHPFLAALKPTKMRRAKKAKL